MTFDTHTHIDTAILVLQTVYGWAQCIIYTCIVVIRCIFGVRKAAKYGTKIDCSSRAFKLMLFKRDRIGMATSAANHRCVLRASKTNRYGRQRNTFTCSGIRQWNIYIYVAALKTTYLRLGHEADKCAYTETINHRQTSNTHLLYIYIYLCNAKVLKSSSLQEYGWAVARRPTVCGAWRRWIIIVTSLKWLMSGTSVLACDDDFPHNFCGTRHVGVVQMSVGFYMEIFIFIWSMHL